MTTPPWQEEGYALKLDHVLIAVADLDAATTTYEGLLGRPAAVRSRHPSYGTRNALFLPEQGAYLELIALDPEGIPSANASALAAFLAAGGEGLYGIALAPDDLDTAVATLRTDGVTLDAPAAGTGVSPDGRVREWRNTRIPAPVLHNSMSLLIAHRGWDWRTDLRQPPLPGRERSAIRRIDHIVFAVHNADDASATWTRRYAAPRTELIPMTGGNIAVHPLGGTNLELIEPTDPAGRIAGILAQGGEKFMGLSIQVPDLEATVTAIRGLGAEVSAPVTGILPRTRIARISPESAAGVGLQLLERIS